MNLRKLFSITSLKYSYVLIISPNKITLLEISNKKGTFHLNNKFEVEDKIFINNNLSEINLKKALSSLKIKIPFKEAIVILNLPIFFTQKIVTPDIHSKNLKDIIETNIKSQLPFAAEKYFWQSILYPAKNSIFLIFYNKEILQSIIEILVSLTILPLKIDFTFNPFLEFIKNKFSLYFEKSYILMSLIENVFSFLVYENGMLQNIYSEIIDINNLEEIIKRSIESSSKNVSFPIDVVYFSKVGVDLPGDIVNQYKILEIDKITGLSPEEIIGLTSASILKKYDESSQITVINLNKEIFIHRASEILKFSIILSVGILIVITSLLYLGYNIISKNNDYIKEGLTQTAPSKVTSIEELQNLISILERYNQNKSIISEKVQKILNIIPSDTNVTQLVFSKNNVKIIVEEPDNTKRENINNILKSNYPNIQINPIFNGLEINLSL
jgi:hypothetical protein